VNDEGFYAGSRTALRKFYRRHLRYPLWRLSNPNRPYEQFYADLVSRRVARGGHDAIGPTARAIRDGSELLDVAVAEGLLPGHVFVDYGCGSLRLGRPVIDYLAPNNFVGMDVTQQFLDFGRDFVGPDLLAAKSPDLAVIDPDSLARIAAKRPHLVASWHVAPKVPDKDLQRFFASILSLVPAITDNGAGRQVLIQFPATDRRRRLNSINWSLSQQDVSELGRSVAPHLQLDFVTLIPRNGSGVTETYARFRTV
jgi:hypothetical protein